MSNKSREAKQERQRQMVQMRRAHRTESDWSTLIGGAARSLRVRPVAPPLPNLSDPGLRPEFFGHTLDYAISPNKSRGPLAMGADVKSKTDAWDWVCGQICMGALHPQRMLRPQIDQLGILLADLFHKIGNCRLSICVGPEMAPRLFACWDSIADLRIAQNNWPLTSGDPGLMGIFEIAPRNVRRARFRLTIEKYRGLIGSDSEPRYAAGNPINVPSDDELLLLVPEERSFANSPFQYSAPTGIRFRTLLRPNVMPRLLLPRNRMQNLPEWTLPCIRRAI